MKKQLLTAVAAAGFLLTAFGGTASAHENVYTVKSGDTLWKISQANHLSLNDLKAWNNLSSDKINVNQKLSLLMPHSHDIQVPSSSTTTSASVSYTVKSGDTLWGIAKTFNTTVNVIKSLNGLTSESLHIGQKLLVKGTKVEALSTVSNNQMVQAIITEAKKYIGTPYVWGGSTPSGFDCSGFTSFVFKRVGVSLPRTTTTQWSATTSVSTPSPGDLVFFETYKTGPSHVGIYLGNNQFIHAGSSGVTISNMTLSYWKDCYLGAKTAF